MLRNANASFAEVLALAVADLTEKGYADAARLDAWLMRLRFAAMSEWTDQSDLQNKIQAALSAALKRGISPSATLRHHPGVSRFSIELIKPQLRTELHRRVRASVDLIKLNREQSTEKMLQRFAGWATSIPEGGSRAVDKNAVKSHVAKSIKSLSYEERRVAIDQGHKLMSAVNATIAQQTGAIAMRWRSHWRQVGYDYREDHKERDQKIYAIRGSWAMDQGLINQGDGYLDGITQPAEEVFCRCYGVYLNNLRDLPKEMLTAKGREAMDKFSLPRVQNAA